MLIECNATFLQFFDPFYLTNDCCNIEEELYNDDEVTNLLFSALLAQNVNISSHFKHTQVVKEGHRENMQKRISLIFLVRSTRISINSMISDILITNNCKNCNEIKSEFDLLNGFD